MRRILLPCVTRMAVPYFTTVCYKRNEFKKKNILSIKICVLIISVRFVENISILETNGRDIIVHVQKFELFNAGIKSIRATLPDEIFC
jgi:hypothetical protein